MDYYEQRDSVCDFLNDESVDVTKTNSEIQNFYAGKSVFITGSTGLIGSLLLEHLLRTCPKIEKIYILMRPKKGIVPEERLNTLFESKLFWKVRRMHKHPREKVQIMFGDCSLPQCGLSENDQQALIDNVSIVFHSAAALRMDEPLRQAYQMNVCATEDLLKIGTKMKKLKAFIYISTAYSFAFRSDISEKFYKTVYSPEEVKQLLDLLDDNEIARMSLKIYEPWENSYSFTKALGENLTEKYSNIIPAAVARPSIIIGCEKEPLAGWINNMYGPVGVSLAASLGIIRVWHGDEDKIADYIPADKVVSALIVIAWQVGLDNVNGKKIDNPVYNIVSSTKSPQTWGEYLKRTEYFPKRDEIAPQKFIREYDLHQEKRLWLYVIKVWIYHVPFAILIDQILKFKGKKPMLLKTFSRIHRVNMSLKFYVHREWVYNQDKVDKIWSEMSPIDRKIFNFSMVDFDWFTFHSHTIRALAVYLLNDDLTTTEETRRRYFRLMFIRQSVTLIFCSAIAYFFRGYMFQVDK